MCNIVEGLKPFKKIFKTTIIIMTTSQLNCIIKIHLFNLKTFAKRVRILFYP